MSDHVSTPAPPNTVPGHREREQLVASFLEFETNFRKNTFLLWLATLIGPGVVTFFIFAVIYFVYGSKYFWELLAAAAASISFLGRFTIITPFPGMTPTSLFWMVTCQDVFVAFFLAFHVGFMFRLPWIGPKIAALSNDGEFILTSQPWMKRMTFLGLLAFVAFPLASTGSIGGAILGRLLGLSRWSIFWGSAIGAFAGNAAMLFLAEAAAEFLPPDSILVKWGGLPIILLTVFVLERRYSAMKKAFLREKVLVDTTPPETSDIFTRYTSRSLK
jgi:hypothetical protein